MDYRQMGVGSLIAVALVFAASPARAQTAALVGSDFTLVLARIDPSSGAFIPLDDNGLASYFSEARCACPTNVVVGLELNSDATAKLASGDTLDATLMIGSDCDNVAATACPTLGSVLTLNASKTSSEETLPTGTLFGPIQGSAHCDALPAVSPRLFAIVRQNGVRLGSHPSLVIAFGGAAPVAPTTVALETADSGLLVSWKEASDTTHIQGYQVLCSPGPANPPDAAYETCAALTPATGTGPFSPLDAGFICSELVTVGTKSARVKGLTNGSTYQVAVIAIGNDGTPSAPSEVVAGAPGPTLGFDDLYSEGGGTAPMGCALAGAGEGDARRGLAGCAAIAALTGSLIRRRRRRRRFRSGRGPSVVTALAFGALAAGSLGAAGAARADDGQGFERSVIIGDPSAPAPARSARHWNLELRFGPYRPAIDSEFADRGQTARPFEETFTSARRVMTQVELDRQLAYRGGTWALGFAGGLYRVSARALSADHLTRTGDTTGLRLIPLSVSLVYRADLWHQHTGFPLVPYAKTGLDWTYWSITDTAKANAMNGTTLGWHAAAGVSLDLAFLDPDSARTMDLESGVNQFALFFEVARYAIDGLGASSALRVGDTTWLAGLMLEL